MVSDSDCITRIWDSIRKLERIRICVIQTKSRKQNQIRPGVFAVFNLVIVKLITQTGEEIAIRLVGQSRLD